MKLKIIITSIFLFVYILINGQQIEVQVVYNNTTEMISKEEIIKKIRLSVKTSELQMALNSNNHITDKNLKIRIAFFDRGVIGQLKLKTEHELTPEKYIEKWQESVKNQSGILFLFVRSKGETDYTFNKMAVSSRLEEEHLFPKVTEFINENLKGDFITIVEKGTKYMAKAITPIWDVDPQDNRNVMKDAEDLTEFEKYWENRINFFYNWKSTFLDLKPMTYEYNRIKVYFLKKNDTIKPIINIYADTTIFKRGSKIEIEGEGYSFSFFSEIFEKIFGKEKEKILLIEPKDNYTQHESYIITLIKAIENENKYSDILYVSDWDWEKDTRHLNFKLKSFTGLREYNRNDKFELVMRKLNDEYKEGEPLPVIHPWYPRTYCNVFASDLARTILFKGIFTTGENYAPWGKHEAASIIHEKLINNENKHFKPLNHDEAWKYTNAGYVVYLTAYNWRYYAGKAHKYEYPGHIATCYPTPEYNPKDPTTGIVIQAGERVGKLFFRKDVWKSSLYDNNIKANLYLGYILK